MKHKETTANSNYVLKINAKRSAKAHSIILWFALQTAGNGAIKCPICEVEFKEIVTVGNSQQ